MITKDKISPTILSERIHSIDLLRGIAVLGILIMNIQNFSMPGSAYINPTAYGDLSGINKWVWILSHVLASGKFMSIFSILFGAGMLLFTERAKAKDNKAGNLHFRRMFWLLIFGLMHAHLIWSGDILVAYALCGMFIYFFRNMKAKTLIILSAAFFMIPILLNLFSGSSIEYWPEESYEQNMQSWLPSVDLINTEVSNMSGSYSQQMESRIPSAIFMQTFYFVWLTFWRVTSMMLLGMALMKLKILSSEKSNKFYLRMLTIGFIFGFAIIALGVYQNFDHQWSMEYSMFFGNQFNYIGSLGIALAYIALVMLISKSNRFLNFKKTFSSVGKMAFTNYILMSVLGIFIFYGNGLGFYGQVDRQHQILIVFGIWMVLLILSPAWLRKFRYGPLEWMWRNLTYWKIQNIKKESKSYF